jgi:sec-independent protein translocase protein TatA
MPNLGVPELLIILVIVAMLFGVGKLPQVFGSIGKGIKEFRKESSLDDAPPVASATPSVPVQTVNTETTEQVN